MIKQFAKDHLARKERLNMAKSFTHTCNKHLLKATFEICIDSYEEY